MNTVTLPANRERQSGVELLKILAIFLIVFNHVTQTLQVENLYIPYHDYVIGMPSDTGMTFLQFLLMSFRYSGTLGNHIFFFCSAWFLLDTNHGGTRKMTRIASDTWALSWSICLLTALILKGNLPASRILYQLFPILAQGNWYVTYYLFFLFLYPSLNFLIRRMNQRNMLRAVLALGLISRAFIRCNLAIWVVFYFLIGYMKIYLKNFCADVKKNLVLLIFSASSLALFTSLLYALSLRVPSASSLLYPLMLGYSFYNPFLFLIVIALLNLARSIPMQSRLINNIAGHSLFIYLIHENDLVRTYFRPWIWQKIYIEGGYSHIILCIFAYSAALFLCSLALSVFYTSVLQKSVWRIGDALFGRVFRLWEKLELRLLSLH
ncbi:MAG: acyltransferase family protein [Oscillibacter sp.]|nr:acyltransferase family protein [Oscillibacter sp.]